MNRPPITRPLCTEAEHADALEEAWSLMKAEPGTPDHDRLELLAILIADYERIHKHITPEGDEILHSDMSDGHGSTNRPSKG
jgi:antitoxin component HigA of HigAB toxin-antitoxin module